MLIAQLDEDSKRVSVVASMFKSLFPKDVSFCAVSSEAVGNVFSTLDTEEQTLLSESATAARREEFALGRFAAKCAMEDLNPKSSFPVLKGERREPLWPDGLVGSIGHSPPWAVAAVALKHDYESLGVDVENTTRKISDKTFARIASNKEAAKLESNKGRMSLFSAKESVFKALYPIVKKEIGFLTACLFWNAENSLFEGEALGYKFIVPTSFTEDYVLTATWIKKEK